MKFERLFMKPLAAMLLVPLMYGSAMASALDRRASEPRNNPAVNDMVRVPGVAGMDEANAMAILQQAGLNPQVKYQRQKSNKYRGKEGYVIRQVPSVAGVAMLGSTVTITIYDPSGKYQDAKGGNSDDRGDDSAGSAPIDPPLAIPTIPDVGGTTLPQHTPQQPDSDKGHDKQFEIPKIPDLHAPVRPTTPGKDKSKGHDKQFEIPKIPDLHAPVRPTTPGKDKSKGHGKQFEIPTGKLPRIKPEHTSPSEQSSEKEDQSGNLLQPNKTPQLAKPRSNHHEISGKNLTPAKQPPSDLLRRH